MEFKSAQDISTLKDWVNKVEKFFQFLSHRKKIKFSEISIYQKDGKGGNFYTLTNQNEEYHPPDTDITCPVCFYFSKIGKLFEILNTDKINFNYIPTDNKKYLISMEDAKQCLKYSGSFK